MENPSSNAALALTSGICPSSRPPDISWPALPLGVPSNHANPAISSDGISMEVVMENGVSMNGNAVVQNDARLSAALAIGSKGIRCLEDHGGRKQSPLMHVNGRDANQWETRLVSFRDMVMGDVANDSQDSDLAVLEVEISDDDILIDKEGLLPEIKFSEREGVSGSRFNVLNLDDNSAEIAVDASAAHLPELVINAGPIAAAKGKATGLTGVGSSKGNGLRKGRDSDEVYSSLEALKNFSSGAPRLGLDAVVDENKENADVNLPDHEKSVAAKGSIIRKNSSLNRKSHMAVRIDDEGNMSVLRNAGD
ncbi:hypothetical protein V6N12_028834 [Hibiscus sabdariffa]|uniref:Uncharacterized protein n=1 Tax=Hibiscus sabdariffa TaxID=183260 RepID=A0ABR2F700_9ROSI